jgi:UDP-N-acetylglucosamine 2-epimerase (non-hydrolysing)
MIDNLFRQLEKLDNYVPSPAVAALREKLPKTYFCMTLHRPSNVDDPVVLERLLTAIHEIGKTVPVVFPCHPRTRKRIKEFGLDRLVTSAVANCAPTGIVLLEPLGYNDFLTVWKDATAVLTDSGGLQEETTALGIPCVTLRENTERPITVSEGSNVLVGTDPEKLKAEVRRILGGKFPEGRIPEKWDGKAGERLVAILDRIALGNRPGSSTFLTASNH